MVTTLPFGRPMTLADLYELPDDGCRYELVDGCLIVSPPVPQDHQELSHDLRDLLVASGPNGWRCRVEYSLPFSNDHQRVPDVLVYRWPLQHPRADKRSPVGPADVGLIVEVVSESSRRTDRFAKPGEYAEAGVPLYWRLETAGELRLHTFVNEGGVYAPGPLVTSTGLVPAPWGEVFVDLGALGWD